MSYVGGPVLAAMLLYAAGALAAPTACTSLPPVTTKVEVSVKAPREPEVAAASPEEIQRLARRSHRSQAGDAITRGLTSSEIRATARFELVERTLSSGGKCTALSKISAHLAVPKLTIRIDSRYHPGRCEYSAILDHEQEHVRITRETLKQWEDRMRRQLESAVKSWHDRWLPSSAQLQIKAAIDQAIADLVRQIQADADRQHAAIDMPAAYEKVRQRCSGW